ncbi:unnamed protein product [Notodromas monacha]|uniref:Splicing factor Cactin n=1 Tax=Notodromas monacha TaxID=399045 RepID=A0A7R9BG15_9CRUS|nr:unnamed protein product [Notodromas monacha]CAG0914786.1 unnamed protein product [Notodromas monacha]
MTEQNVYSTGVCFLCGSCDVGHHSGDIPVIPMYEIRFVVENLDETVPERNYSDDQSVEGCARCRGLVFQALELKAELEALFFKMRQINSQKFRMPQCSIQPDNTYTNLEPVQAAPTAKERRCIPCTSCGRSLKSELQLEEHVAAVHRKERNFHCPICSARFGWKSLLQEHVRKTHSNIDTTLVCQECSKSLKTKRGLVEHMWSRHSIRCPGANFKKCRFCDKIFITVQKLKEHERRHSGERPYPCMLCRERSPDRIVQRLIVLKDAVQKARLRDRAEMFSVIHILEAETKNSTEEIAFTRKNVHRNIQDLPSILPHADAAQKLIVMNGGKSTRNDSMELNLKLLEKRMEVAERRKQNKLKRKAIETPEEKRARRLAKKEIKERSRKAKMGWDSDYLHYTNADNPFGDSNLLDTFTWNKKLEKEGLTTLPAEELELRKRQKMEENRRELEKVKERRLAMEKEREEREHDMWLAQRSKEAEQFKEWEKQEELFHLEQAKLRSKIRIQDGRAKPIDLLAKYISSQEDVDAVEMHEPYTYLTGLGIDDLEDLIEDIKVYQELEHDANQPFWEDMTIIVQDELLKLQKAKAQADAETHGAVFIERVERPGVHASVAKDVAEVFKGKSPEQLKQLKDSITGKVAAKKSGPPGARADLPYWESLLQQLHAYMARARLREAHQQGLRKKLEILKAEQGVEEAKKLALQNAAISEPVEGGEEEKERRQEDVSDEEDNEANTEEDLDVSMIETAVKDYEDGRYSPTAFDPDDLEPGTLFVNEDDDAKRLDYSRQLVQSKGRRVEDVMTSEEKALQKEARKGMTDDEAVFGVEAELEQQSYLWSDKYRPRKPRYFNRVHTGFEWNKYNQTHYDMDNPPPKIVQGYKFNIFYPDLLDKSSTPAYSITPCGDQGDFAILRFKAGPPYEDIAFKIVNREWEYSYRRGFRCQFHNSIFQLWFHFKRYRYRR